MTNRLYKVLHFNNILFFRVSSKYINLGAKYPQVSTPFLGLFVANLTCLIIHVKFPFSKLCNGDEFSPFPSF